MNSVTYNRLVLKLLKAQIIIDAKLTVDAASNDFLRNPSNLTNGCFFFLQQNFLCIRQQDKIKHTNYCKMNVNFRNHFVNGFDEIDFKSGNSNRWINDYVPIKLIAIIFTQYNELIQFSITLSLNNTLLTVWINEQDYWNTLFNRVYCVCSVFFSLSLEFHFVIPWIFGNILVVVFGECLLLGLIN